MHILAYFDTYVGIFRKIQALYGCIRILRRIIRNTLTYITYATATAYNWLNIHVWTQPYDQASSLHGTSPYCVQPGR
jgi:hypothetical protein